MKVKNYFLPFLALLLLSFFFIFYQFNQIPKNIAYDEIQLAKLAISLDQKPYTPFSPLADGHATLYFYLILFSFKLFGISNFSLRLPSAIFGIGNVIMFYLIMQNVFKKKGAELSINLPFLLSLIFLTLRWFFNFVRFSFEMPFLLFLELTSIYFLLSFFNTRKKLSLVAAGVFAGLAFNSYQPGRIFFLVPLLLLVLKKEGARSFFFFTLPLIIIAAPVTFHLFKYNAEDIRFHQQFFFKNTELSLEKKLSFFADNIKKTALMFNFEGDTNGRHNYPGKPIFNPILGTLFLIGLALTIFNLKNFYNQFFLIYFIVSFVPTLLTYPWENPNMLRTFTAIPSAIYFISQPLTFALSKIKKKQRAIFLIFFFILFLMSSIYEIRTYFKYQKEVFTYAFETKRDLKSIILDKEFQDLINIKNK